MEVVVTTATTRRAKLQSNCHHQQTNTQLFTGRMPFLSPNQQCRSTEGENITFYGLAHPKIIWGLPNLSLTNSSSWIPWRRVAMPLISPGHQMSVVVISEKKLYLGEPLGEQTVAVDLDELCVLVTVLQNDRQLLR